MIAAAEETESRTIPRIPVGEWIDRGFLWVNDHLEPVLDAVKTVITSATQSLADLLNAPDALITVVLLSLLAWLIKDWKLGLLSAVLLTFIISVDQWENAMLTLAVVLVAAAVALALSVPLGILAARSPAVSGAVRPVMDLMQTMPAFVWLVPVVMLFSIGLTAAVVATVIFCMPPGVRLTELGIRQVDPEVVEAGHAFGSTEGQILRRIQLPLALPTIMAGVNQVIMLALSMAVIAGLVGARGLGGEVNSAIGSLDIGLGFEAGLSVVVLAIYLDRVTAAIGDRGPGSNRLGRLTRLIRSRRSAQSNEPAVVPTA